MRIRTIIVSAAAMCALGAGTASASTSYRGSSSQGEPAWLMTSRGVVTRFKILITERCVNASGRFTGAISGHYAYRGQLRRDGHGSFSHRVRKRGLLTAQRDQRFDVTITFSGTVRGPHARGSFRGDFRFFTLRGRYVASCTTGPVSWLAQAS
jgi:hypothetical protein